MEGGIPTGRKKRENGKIKAISVPGPTQQQRRSTHADRQDNIREELTCESKWSFGGRVEANSCHLSALCILGAVDI